MSESNETDFEASSLLETSSLLESAGGSSDDEVIVDWQRKYDKLLQDHITTLEENSSLYSKCSTLTVANKELKVENTKLHADSMNTKKTYLKKLRHMQSKVKKAEEEAAVANSKIMDESDIEELTSLTKIKLESFAKGVRDAIYEKENGHPPAKDAKEELKDKFSYKIMSLFDEQRYELLKTIKKPADSDDN